MDANKSESDCVKRKNESEDNDNSKKVKQTSSETYNGKEEVEDVSLVRFKNIENVRVALPLSRFKAIYRYLENVTIKDDCLIYNGNVKDKSFPKISTYGRLPAITLKDKEYILNSFAYYYCKLNSELSKKCIKTSC